MKISDSLPIKKNVAPASRRAAHKFVDDARKMPRLWGAREYVQANNDMPEGFYLMYVRFSYEEAQSVHLGEIVKRMFHGVEVLRFMTAHRKSSMNWLFHYDPGALLWGPLKHPQEFCTGAVESIETIADDRDEEEV